MLAFQMSYRHTITACITNNAFNSAPILSTIRFVRSLCSLLLTEKLSFFQNYIYLSDIFERHTIKDKSTFSSYYIPYSIQMTSIQMNTIIAVNASILEKTNSEKIESKYNTCIVHKRQQQRQQYNQPPRRLEDKNALPVSLRFLPNSYFRNRNSLSTTIAADLGVLHNKNHTSLDQLLEHFDRSCEMMSSEDQEQEDATVTDASTITSLPIALSSLSSSILTSTTYDSTNTASTAKSSLKRKIRIANDDSHNEIVSSSTQRRCDDDNYQRSNNSPKRMKRMKYARRNSVVIRDSKQLSQIATDLSTISKN